MPYHDRLLGALMDVMRRAMTIVQNLPVPFDRRVWLERQALVAAGYQAASVCSIPSTAEIGDIGLSPDPGNPLSDVPTEYMTFEPPAVAIDRRLTVGVRPLQRTGS